MAIRNEIFLILLFALAVFLFLCNFGIAGVVGGAISDIMFGIFGLTAYVMPLVFFVMTAFGMVNSGSFIAFRKLLSGILLFLIAGIVCDLFTGEPQAMERYDLKEIYIRCSQGHGGGGVIGGSAAFVCCLFLGMTGTVLVLLVAAIISLVILTEKSFVSGVKSGGRRMYERSLEDREYRRERASQRRMEQEELRKRRQEERRLREEEKENEKILRMDKKVSGVMLDTALTAPDQGHGRIRDDLHEINLDDFEEHVEEKLPVLPQEQAAEDAFDFDKIRITGAGEGDGDDAQESDELMEITRLISGAEEPDFGARAGVRQEPLPEISQDPETPQDASQAESEDKGGKAVEDSGPDKGAPPLPGGVQKVQGGGLKPRKAEIQLRALHPWPWQGIAIWVAALGYPVQLHSPRVWYPHGPGRLVKGLARRVVPGAGHNIQCAVVPHIHYMGVSPGHHQTQKRGTKLRVGDIVGGDMPP